MPGMLLIDPATYLSVDQFKAQPNDQNLSRFSDDDLTDILVRASAKVDGICNRSFLPQRQTETFEGAGTNMLDLFAYPIIAVYSVQLVMPGFAPFALPLGDIMFDYAKGVIRSWSPMVWRSLGVANVFPRNGLPIVVDFSTGFGYPIPPPGWSGSSSGNGTLSPATLINFAVSTRTQAGESLPSAAQIVSPSAQGGVTIAITVVPGAYLYRIYASIGPNTSQAVAAAAGDAIFTPASLSGIAQGQVLTFGFGTPQCENLTVAAPPSGGTFTTTTPSQFAHGVGDPIVAAMTLVEESPATNYGSPTMNVTVANLNPPDIGALPAPLVDSSPWPVPKPFIEATRLLALSIVWEQNNLANRGVQMTTESNKRFTWRSTEGNSGKGTPLAEEQAAAMLRGYVFGGLL